MREKQISGIRYPAVAGIFYPVDPQELKQILQGFLDEKTIKQSLPKAMIVPHAGLIYSGSIAASAYAQLQTFAEQITRIVLLGPTHHVAFHGMAFPTAHIFVTPLGNIPIDQQTISSVTHFPFVSISDLAHLQEHSLEVQLPFLQALIPTFSLVPAVIGESSPQEVGEILEALWGGDETLIIISSDLSHYHGYTEAKQLDKHTSEAIESFHIEAINHHHACGRNAVNGLLLLAKKKHLQVTTVDLRNSGDTAGSKDRVVGYGAYLFH